MTLSTLAAAQLNHILIRLFSPLFTSKLRKLLLLAANRQNWTGVDEYQWKACCWHANHNWRLGVLSHAKLYTTETGLIWSRRRKPLSVKAGGRVLNPGGRHGCQGRRQIYYCLWMWNHVGSGGWSWAWGWKEWGLLFFCWPSSYKMCLHTDMHGRGVAIGRAQTRLVVLYRAMARMYLLFRHIALATTIPEHRYVLYIHPHILTRHTRCFMLCWNQLCGLVV